MKDANLFCCSTSDAPTLKEVLATMEKFRNAGKFVLDDGPPPLASAQLIESPSVKPGIVFRMRHDFGFKTMFPQTAMLSDGCCDEPPSFLHDFDRWWRYTLRKVEQRNKNALLQEAPA